MVALDSIFIAIDTNYTAMQNLLILMEITNQMNYKVLMNDFWRRKNTGGISTENLQKVEKRSFDYKSNSENVNIGIQQFVNNYIMEAITPHNQLAMNSSWSLWL